MKVKELIEELEKIPDKDMDIMYYKGPHRVADLEVYFEETRVLHNSGWSSQVIVMKGEY